MYIKRKFNILGKMFPQSLSTFIAYQQSLNFINIFFKDIKTSLVKRFRTFNY